jgi:hypothetical protein
LLRVSEQVVIVVLPDLRVVQSVPAAAGPENNITSPKNIVYVHRMF